ERPQRFLVDRDLGFLVRQRKVFVGNEVAELRLILVADRLLERDGCLSAAPDVLDLVTGEVKVAPDLDSRWLAPQLRTKLPLRADNLVQLLDYVNGHADRSRLVGQGPGNGLPDPPGCVRRELEALAVVELLRGPDEADRSLLDQIEEREPLVAVLLRDRDNETQVCLHHLLLGAVVAALDPLH